LTILSGEKLSSEYIRQKNYYTGIKLNIQMSKTKKTLFFISLAIVFFACTKEKIKNLEINPTIEKSVDSLLDECDDSYNNRLLVEIYYDDSLVTNTYETVEYTDFNSRYFWNNDTLKIYGNYTSNEGLGFVIKIHDNIMNVYNMPRLHIFNKYCYPMWDIADSIDSKKMFLCIDSKVILSQIPHSFTYKPIYGYARLKGNNFFEKDGNNVPHKVRINMDVYFRSTYQDSNTQMY
jgi:hypothetical protein